LIYVDESWSLQCELSSSLYDHSAEWTKWVLIYVSATHVNRLENRKIDRFTALHRCVCAQKLSCAFAMTVWMLYISCSVCAKTLLSFYVYEQRLCRVFTVYVIAMHVNWPENAKNQSIYCITSVCICTKAESCLCIIYIYVVYELQHVCKDVAVILCMCKLQRADDHVVIASLFNCVWVQCVNKALLLLCQYWWDYSALLTSIACRRFVVSILYR